MKKLKTSSAYKIIILILINIFVQSTLLKIISILYAALTLKKDTFILIFVFILVFLSNNYKVDFIKYGVVEETNSSYIVVNKILYKNIVYTDKEYKMGQLVITEKGEINLDTDKLKYNYLFISYEEPNIVLKSTFQTLINDKIENFSSISQKYLRKILLNTYDTENEIEFIGYGFSFYYLLLIIKRKNRLACLFVLIIYILFFKFDIKFYLIICELLSNLFKLDKNHKLIFKIIIILLINKYLLFNKSIWISFLFIYLSSFSINDKSILFIFQSLCFNQITIGLTIFYRTYMAIKIGLFLSSFLVLNFVKLENIYLYLINISSFIIKILSFGVRGKINYFLLVIYFIVIKVFKVNNKYIKYFIILIFLITPLNNPIQHVNFIDVGQGNATLIHGNLNQYNILVDTGSKYNYSKLKASLYAEGVYTIDYLIISHDDEDHCGNVDNLLKDFKIKNIITSGIDIKLNDLYLKYLDLGKYDNDNDNSLVYLVKMDDRTILLPGDASKKVENIIVNKYGVSNLDILDIGHHGSNTSSSSYFIGTLNPKFVVISTNGKYGHPHEETLKTLDSYKLEYLITKNEGSIKFYLTKLFDWCITKKRLELF